MNFSVFLTILKSRLSLILLTLLIAVGTTAALTFTAQKRYTATTYLVLNFKEESAFESTLIPAQLSSSYLETQLDVIRSPKVALKVVELLQLDTNPNWISTYKRLGTPSTPIKDWIAGQLMTNLSVDPLPNNSRVVSLGYQALTPIDAAKVANAFAQAFLATTLELQIEPARRNAAWFDEQLKILRKRLEEARARMTRFQVENGIVALDEKLAAETTRLDDISKQLVGAQNDTFDVRSRQLGVNHPAYVRAIERERSLQRALNDQKRNILQLKGLRDELDARANEVDSEQQNYAATLQAYYKTAMEGQFNSTNIVVLSPAVPPQDPSSPNVPLNMASAGVLGLILGIAAAIAAEMLNPRVLRAKETA